MARIKRVQCPLCGGDMKRATINSCLGMAIGLLLILIAIGSLIAFPPGLLFSFLLFVVGILCGWKKVWRCRQCGHVLGRA